jgi:DNA primase
MKRIRPDGHGLLFNEAVLWVDTDEPVFAVEGVFDTTHVYPNAVAFLGKPLKSHILPLRAARRPVVVCLDGDAWEEGWALAMTLRHYGLRAGSIRLPARRDPNDMERVWLLEKARDSLTMS